MKLSEVMRQREILSFEIFPPKTDAGMEKLPEILQQLCVFKPEYISTTYGAGGTNRTQNLDVCKMVQAAGTTPVAHYTVVGVTRKEIKAQLQEYLDNGVNHMLALRGDLPFNWTGTNGDFKYATDLVAFVRQEFGDQFEIAVAGSPEGHIACRSLESDVAVLKQKQDLGANYIMTQLCWDMEAFKRWLDMLDRANITMPIDVGIMPVLDMASTINMALSRNGCVMDRKLCEIISKNWIFPNPFVEDCPDAAAEQKKADFRKAGIEYTVRQIDEYRTLGINGIHLYALNKTDAVSEIIDAVGMHTVV